MFSIHDGGGGCQSRQRILLFSMKKKNTVSTLIKYILSILLEKLQKSTLSKPKQILRENGQADRKTDMVRQIFGAPRHENKTIISTLINRQ